MILPKIQFKRIKFASKTSSPRIRSFLWRPYSIHYTLLFPHAHFSPDARPTLSDSRCLRVCERIPCGRLCAFTFSAFRIPHETCSRRGCWYHHVNMHPTTWITIQLGLLFCFRCTLPHSIGEAFADVYRLPRKCFVKILFEIRSLPSFLIKIGFNFKLNPLYSRSTFPLIKFSIFILHANHN